MALSPLSDRFMLLGIVQPLSHRTVGFHLYRIFPKLGVTSRAGLNATLGVERGDK
jgi:hypothetical protein